MGITKRVRITNQTSETYGRKGRGGLAGVTINTHQRVGKTTYSTTKLPGGGTIQRQTANLGNGWISRKSRSF